MSDEWVVTMPKLGETVTEGTIGNWLKQAGDTVESIGRRYDVSARSMERVNHQNRGHVLKAGETVVVYITGDGLKTIDAVRPAVRTIAVSPDPDDVDAALERRLASAS